MGSPSPSSVEASKEEVIDESQSLDEHLFDLAVEHGHEQVSLASAPESRYLGIIAMKNTVLGPALGGTRFWDYSTDAEAVIDVLRLSRGMTYKAAVAGLNLGGGKSVILGNPHDLEREAVMRAHGRHIELLNGRYITGEDVGTSPTDMHFVREETRHVVGLAGLSGDPSPATALGVFRGIKACAMFRYEDENLTGKTVALQGCGHVGFQLGTLLNGAGARLVVSDIDEEKAQRCVDELGATAVSPEEIYGVDADIFAPCALGAVINDVTLRILQVDIVAGAANNQLAEDRHGEELYQRGIVYAPDYVINGGGVINASAEVSGWSPEKTHEKVLGIFNTVHGILQVSQKEGIPSHKAADRLAEWRIRTSKQSWFQGHDHGQDWMFVPRAGALT